MTTTRRAPRAAAKVRTTAALFGTGCLMTVLGIGWLFGVAVAVTIAGVVLAASALLLVDLGDRR